MVGTNNILGAILLTLLAGLSTGIGGAFVFFSKSLDRRVLSVSLGLSAGVMIYVSLIELFPEANRVLSSVYGNKTGLLYTMFAFFGGILLIAIIDRLIPKEKNPHEMLKKTNQDGQNGSLKRTGLITTLAIAAHNFPEGMASFVSATQSIRLALPILVAIAIHNIPEGIAISMPIYHATGSRRIAMRYSLVAGLMEPLGAILCYLILLPYLSAEIMGVLFAGVAGIMVFISLDELLPNAQLFGEQHLSTYGLVGGMAIMALSLWLFL